MSRFLRYAFAVAIALGAQSVLAQPVNGCPAGQAMQSSDPSGKRITCVPIPDVSALQGQDANILKMLGDLSERIDNAGIEKSIVGRWAMTGGTNCLQSTNGFTPELSPVGGTAVSLIRGTVNAVRTFYADGTGATVGVTHTLSEPSLVYNPPASPTVGSQSRGGASVATLDARFVWRIEADGTLFIDDDNTIPQTFVMPERPGWRIEVANVAPFAGYISKDRRTIVMTHKGLQLETSTVRDDTGGVRTAPRFCTRDRILIRLD